MDPSQGTEEMKKEGRIERKAQDKRDMMVTNT